MPELYQNLFDCRVNKWLEERTRAQKSTNAYARNFRLPKVTAEEEIAELIENDGKYDDDDDDDLLVDDD